MADIPVWNNEGIEPSDEIKQNGFARGYRPPAEYFNWFFNRVSLALAETSSPTKILIGTGSEAGEDCISVGNLTKATGYASQAFGTETTASEQFAHAEGWGCTASGEAAHAEGFINTASGGASHAEGSQNTASGMNSHAEGTYGNALGDYSHTGGSYSTANGNCSFAHGSKVTANAYNFVIGKWNKTPAETSPTVNTGDLFVIGSGLEGGAKANAFRVTAAGEVMGTQAYTASGADYAELFEWLDGNPDNSDRRGLFVTLDGEKIRPANADDDYILGVVSATPSIIGNAQTDDWHGKYVTDVFGARVVENGAYKLSEDFDEEKDDNYTSRLDRAEWAAVGLTGKLIVCDDGTCNVNGYCYPSENGIATASETGYRVIARIDENHIKVIVK